MVPVDGLTCARSFVDSVVFVEMAATLRRDCNALKFNSADSAPGREEDGEVSEAEGARSLSAMSYRVTATASSSSSITMHALLAAAFSVETDVCSIRTCEMPRVFSDAVWACGGKRDEKAEAGDGAEGCVIDEEVGCVKDEEEGCVIDEEEGCAKEGCVIDCCCCC